MNEDSYYLVQKRETPALYLTRPAASHPLNTITITHSHSYFYTGLISKHGNHVKNYRHQLYRIVFIYNQQRFLYAQWLNIIYCMDTKEILRAARTLQIKILKT